jgi:hypothetical protein
MNTLQEYYDFTYKGVFDCKSKFGLHNVIKESGNVLLQNKAFKKSSYSNKQVMHNTGVKSEYCSCVRKTDAQEKSTINCIFAT